MSEEFVVTRYRGKLLTAVFSGNTAVSLTLEPDGGESILNNVYVAKVQSMVKNLGAAFVELDGEQKAYLQLEAADPVRVLNRPNATSLRPGDELVVQVCRDALKTKVAAATVCVSLTGRYCVVTEGKASGVSISSKISDSSFKKRMRERVASFLTELGVDTFGVILRTNSAKVDEDVLLGEIGQLVREIQTIHAQAAHRTCYTCLRRGVPGYVSQLRDARQGRIGAIVTDQSDCFEEISKYLKEHQPQDLGVLSFYQDPMVSLSALKRLERVMTEALDKKVWLKSGGYLVIDPTEAMVVIDVNTGKYAGKKTFEETILKINLEAATEIARQLKLRNLSGIIMVDFIDMKSQEHQELLLETLKRAVSADSVKTVVVDITRLGLVELTRKKVRKPLYEQVRGEERL